LRAGATVVAVLLAALLVMLALPIEEWRTGDRGLMPLDKAPERAAPPWPPRLWIDTDAACGHGERTDADDCLALVLLANEASIEIVGIAIVAGNAPLDEVERTTRALIAQTGRGIAFHSGAAAQKALLSALEEGPLTVLALGPLTNLAAALREQPALAGRVARLVAVMGRRPGHIFHPAEGAGGGMLLGHGPVFRDFNFVLDVDAASFILDLGVPTSLVPYDAARGIELTSADLDRLAARGGAYTWVAQRARPWLEYWRSDIGRAGFYPFDLIAAPYVIEPSWFRCTAVRAWVGHDETLFGPFRRSKALLVTPQDSLTLYCGGTRGDLKAKLMRRLLS
jgi:inosine-uridine nucleoside N-ribohydrolase